MNESHRDQKPPFTKWLLGLAATVGLTGMLCCVAPMVLFIFGIMGGVYAISFADFFYEPTGEAGTGAWILRVVAAVVAGIGIWRYRKAQNQCSIDPNRKRSNLILMTAMVGFLGVGAYLSLESLSSWYFDQYIVPAQQVELGLKE